MHFAFLDEFGHVGPFIARTDRRFNSSPVFGLGGMLLPEDAVRPFATWFFQLKGNLLGREIARAGAHPATWEKKGTSLFTAKAIRKYPSVRGAGKRLINRVSVYGGTIFFYGREKYQIPHESHAIGLHKTVLSHSIRRLNLLCSQKNQYFMMILDQHSSRTDLLETAAKTMFGSDPAPKLLEPPFEVESHLYQTAQAADWISAILGHLWAYRLRPTEYPELRIFETFFGALINSTESHSAVDRARTPLAAPVVPTVMSASGASTPVVIPARIGDVRLNNAVDGLIAALKSGQITMLKTVFSVSRSVPPEIDGRMLAIGRDAIGRELTTDEKRAVRDKLIFVVRSL
jgi:hypothetical protein